MHGSDAWAAGQRPQCVGVAEYKHRGDTGAAGAQLRGLRSGEGRGPPDLLGGNGGTIARRGPQRLGELSHRPLSRQVAADQPTLYSWEGHAEYHPGKPDSPGELGGRLRREVILQLHQGPVWCGPGRQRCTGSPQVLRDRLAGLGAEALRSPRGGRPGHQQSAPLPGHHDGDAEHHEQHSQHHPASSPRHQLRLCGQHVQRMAQIIRVRAGELHPVLVSGMREAQPLGVQPLPLQAEPLSQRRVRTIGEIAAAWVP